MVSICSSLVQVNPKPCWNFRALQRGSRPLAWQSGDPEAPVPGGASHLGGGQRGLALCISGLGCWVRVVIYIYIYLFFFGIWGL